MRSAATTIKRGFFDVGESQVHYRTAGPASGRPIVMLHQSPGSSKQLEGLISELSARGRHVFAPDTAGNGDSDPHPAAVPTIENLAQTAFAAIEQGVDGPFDLYGSHTGASIAMEIAIAHPDKVRRLIIDGMGLYSSTEQSDVLDHYAREILPDQEATHLMKVWHFCRDQHLFWPYYNRTAEGRMPGGLPDIDYLHDFVVEVLKAMRSYHHSYRAAFRHPKRDRLPLIQAPTIVVCSPSDMLHGYFKQVASIIPDASSAELPAWNDPNYHAKTADILEGFLA